MNKEVVKKTNIYALIDPITNEVKYIGKSNNIIQRYKAHINKSRKHQKNKIEWINSLNENGLKPLIFVLDEVPMGESKFWETYWVSQMKTWGYTLFNYTGRYGCVFLNQTSFKKGNIPANKGKAHSKEAIKKMSENSSTRGKPAWNRKKVVQMTLDGEFINIWDSLTEASIKTGSSTSKVSLCCNGKRNIHNNFKWKYYENK